MSEQAAKQETDLNTDSKAGGAFCQARAASSLRDLLPQSALVALGRTVNWQGSEESSRALALAWAQKDPARLEGGALENNLWGRAEALGLAPRESGPFLSKMEGDRAIWSSIGSGGRVALEGLPVFWGVTQSLRKGQDEDDDRNVAALIFLAALRRDPRGSGAPRALALFGSFSFEGKASDALRRGRVGEARAKAGVIESLEDAESVISGLKGAGRFECAALISDNPLWRALPELLNPAFYERRALETSVEASSVKRRPPGL